MNVIQFGGEEYTPVTQEWYNRFIAAKENSEKVRFQAVENFRVWCVANKGVSTVEEGLALCTPEELSAQLYAAGGSGTGTYIVSQLISNIVNRLQNRAAQAKAELAETPVEAIMPDEDEEKEEDTDHAADND